MARPATARRALPRGPGPSARDARARAAADRCSACAALHALLYDSRLGRGRARGRTLGSVPCACHVRCGVEHTVHALRCGMQYAAQMMLLVDCGRIISGIGGMLS